MSNPFLGHVIGVLIVGVVVTVIVVTAGMVSTTYVQFIKGSMLVFFCAWLTVLILHQGLTAIPAPATPTLPTGASGWRASNHSDSRRRQTSNGAAQILRRGATRWGRRDLAGEKGWSSRCASIGHDRRR